MKKIIVIGCPGSGKSTLSKALHQITGIPLYHLDQMYWNEDRTTVEQSIFRERLAEVMGQDTWILDGNYGATMELRMASCDTVIFLDYAQEVCFAGVRERKGKMRSDMPWVETEEDPSFIEFIHNYPLSGRPQVMALLDKYNYKDIYTFANRNEGELFLFQLQHGIITLD